MWKTLHNNYLNTHDSIPANNNRMYDSLCDLQRVLNRPEQQQSTNIATHTHTANMCKSNYIRNVLNNVNR